MTDAKDKIKLLMQDGSNFKDWQHQLKILLVDADAWDIVTGDEEEPPVETTLPSCSNFSRLGFSSIWN